MPDHFANDETGSLAQMSLPDRLARAIGSLVATRTVHFIALLGLAANRFWEMQPPQRFMVENSFFEHLGLIGGFLLVAWLDLRKSYRASLGGSYAQTQLHG